MNTEHTPGPWHVDYAQGIIAANGTAVAYVEADHSDTPSPDARLIAAAPDLLEALKALLGWNPTCRSGIDDDAFGATIDAARAAIAKAEGKA